MGCSTSMPQTMEDEIRDAMHARRDFSRLLERVDNANGVYVAALLSDSGGHQDGSHTLESNAWSRRTETLTMATTKGKGQ